MPIAIIELSTVLSSPPKEDAEEAPGLAPKGSRAKWKVGI